MSKSDILSMILVALIGIFFLAEHFRAEQKFDKQMQMLEKMNTALEEKFSKDCKTYCDKREVIWKHIHNICDKSETYPEYKYRCEVILNLEEEETDE